MYYTDKFKVFLYIRTLSRDEIKEFKVFIKSSFNSSGRNYSVLLNKILNDLPGFLYFEKKLKENTKHTLILKSRLSELGKILEDYFIYVNLRSNDEIRYFLLLKELKTRELVDKGNKNLYKAQKVSENVNKFESEKFINIYQLESLLEEIFHKRNDRKKYRELLKKSLETFVTYFYSRTFDYLIELEYYKAMFPEDNSMKFFEFITSNITSIDFAKLLRLYKNKKYVVIYLYYLAYLILVNSDKAKFLEFKKYLEITEKNLGLEAKRTFYYISMLFFRSLREEDLLEFISDWFIILNKVLKLIKERGRNELITLTHFRDAAKICILTTDNKQLESFLDKHLNLLPKEEKENMKNYVSAILEFKNNNFEKARIAISRFYPKNTLLKIDQKKLNIIINIELNQYEQVYYELDSFRHFLKNNENISKNQQMDCYSFIRGINYYLKILNNVSPQEIVLITNKINLKESFSEKKWLLNKIQEYKLK
jgi:hypothetical protein